MALNCVLWNQAFVLHAFAIMMFCKERVADAPTTGASYLKVGMVMFLSFIRNLIN